MANYWIGHGTGTTSWPCSLAPALEAACLGPCAPGLKFAQVALADPGCLRLDAAPRDCVATGGDQALLPCHACAEIVRDWHAVGVAEYFDSAAAIRRARIPKPLHGLLVITEG